MSEESNNTTIDGRTVRATGDLHEGNGRRTIRCRANSASASTPGSILQRQSRCTGDNRPYGGTFLTLSEYMRPRAGWPR